MNEDMLQMQMMSNFQVMKNLLKTNKQKDNKNPKHHKSLRSNSMFSSVSTHGRAKIIQDLSKTKVTQ